MLRLGQSTVKVSRGVTATGRKHALLPSSGHQLNGISMLKSVGSGQRQGPAIANRTEQQGTHGVSSSSRGSSVCVSRKVPFAFSAAAHMSTPKRLMSTAVGGGDPPPQAGGDSAAANAAGAAGDLGPDVMAGAADAAVAAAGAVDQVRHALIMQW